MSSTEHDHLPVVIRGEREEDLTAIRDVNLLAFRGEAEAKLVEALRRTPEFIPALSLVALHDGHVVGHILFSRIAIVSDAASVPALALAPMAVRPEYQGHGIGSKLVLQVSRGSRPCLPQLFAARPLARAFRSARRRVFMTVPHVSISHQRRSPLRLRST